MIYIYIYSYIVCVALEELQATTQWAPRCLKKLPEGSLMVPGHPVGPRMFPGSFPNPGSATTN